MHHLKKTLKRNNIDNSTLYFFESWLFTQEIKYKCYLIWRKYKWCHNARSTRPIIYIITQNNKVWNRNSSFIELGNMAKNIITICFPILFNINIYDNTFMVKVMGLCSFMLDTENECKLFCSKLLHRVRFLLI